MSGWETATGQVMTEHDPLLIRYPVSYCPHLMGPSPLLQNPSVHRYIIPCKLKVSRFSPPRAINPIHEYRVSYDSNRLHVS
jgi:hypothetical protein